MPVIFGSEPPDFDLAILQIDERLEKPDNFVSTTELKNPEISGLTTCLTTYEKSQIEA